MVDRITHVRVKVDVSAFIAAMQRALAAMSAHRARHHQVELPWRSSMHVAYDRRRRARRRRRSR